jgi:hypothetical protein
MQAASRGGAYGPGCNAREPPVAEEEGAGSADRQMGGPSSLENFQIGLIHLDSLEFTPREEPKNYPNISPL